MRSISQVAKLTGVSIRTLQYYDEIGLLKPTKLTEAGYYTAYSCCYWPDWDSINFYKLEEKRYGHCPSLWGFWKTNSD